MGWLKWTKYRFNATLQYENLEKTVADRQQTNLCQYLAQQTPPIAAIPEGKRNVKYATADGLELKIGFDADPILTDDLRITIKYKKGQAPQARTLLNIITQYDPKQDYTPAAPTPPAGGGAGTP